MFKPALRLSCFLLCAAAMSGCAVMTAGMQKGDERSFVRSLNDVNAARAIQARMKRADAYKLSGVDVEVAEGVVLLSGNVPRKEDRIEAARIAWSAPKVDQIGNEIMIRDKQGFLRNTKDGLLEKSVRARLAADKYVKGRNFNVETHDGIVYLMGVARDPAELDRAARIAALTRGTVEVISYARVHDENAQVSLPRRPEAQVQAPAQGSGPNLMTTEPLPQQNRSDRPAPRRLAPMDEPIPYSAPALPQALGQSIVPVTPPSDPNAPPYYIDPETGNQIQVKNWDR